MDQDQALACRGQGLRISGFRALGFCPRFLRLYMSPVFLGASLHEVAPRDFPNAAEAARWLLSKTMVQGSKDVGDSGLRVIGS